jgi:recombination DNA repair RAD52 pathway protein
MPLNERQLEQLFKPINPKRIKKTPQGYSHLEEWDVEAHLNRIFGFLGWDKEISYGLIFEDEVSPGRWTVAYHARCKLTVWDADGLDKSVKEDAATGSGINQSSRVAGHDLAIKDAVSSAVKRAAKALGNQFGLSLYDDGSTKSVVGTSLAYDPLEEPESVTPPEEVREQVAGLHKTLLGERDAPDLSEAPTP